MPCVRRAVSIQAYSDKESPLWPIYVDTSLTLPEHSSWRDKPDTSKWVLGLHAKAPHAPL